jgi:hypothetical protein
VHTIESVPTKVVAIGALIAPLGLCAALVPVRDDVANTNAALVLVLVVVGFAASGHRAAGVLSALSAGVSFDFFLTSPYESVAIRSGDDIETFVLLLVVGVGVTELAMWGRRQQAKASRDEGYVAGISAASEIVARGSASPSDLIAGVSRQLAAVLGAERVRFDYGTGLDYPRLHANGTVTWRRTTWDVGEGLPDTDREIELIAESGGAFRGRFLLSFPRGRRLSRTQVLVATSLASDVASSLAEFGRAGSGR